MNRFFLFLCACALGLAGSTSAQPIRLHVLADSAFVGEPFELAIAAQRPSGGRLILPRIGAGPITFGDVTLTKLSDNRLVSDAAGRNVDSLIFEATAFGIDSAQVGPLTFQFVDIDGDTLSSSTGIAFLPIRSVVPEEAEGMRDLANLAEFPIPWWVWVLIGLGVLAVLLLAGWLLRRWRNRPVEIEEPDFVLPDVSPYQEAIARLKALSEAPDGVPAKPYFVELSDAVRTYLSKTFGIQALEMTTRELMRTFGGRASRRFVDLPADALDALDKSLRLADLAKFADYDPLPSERERALNDAGNAVTLFDRHQRRQQDATRAAVPGRPSLPPTRS